MLRANFGPSASATATHAAGNTNSPTSSTSNTLDTLTIPIVYGTLGAVLTLATIIIGIISIRRQRRGHRDAETDQVEHELDERQPARVYAASTQPTS